MFVPTFTFAASAGVVALVGASPVFVDVLEDTYNIDPASLEAAIALIKRDGKLRARAVMPVDLFGQPADYRAIEPSSRREGLKMLCDTAQAFGARFNGKVTGSIGDAAATSFFPAKPLGCYGDGGASFTNDDGLAELLKSIRNHGAGTDRYENVRVGMNSRLDTIQAAILIEKLKISPRQNGAARSRGAALQRGSREVEPHPRSQCDLRARNRPGRNIRSRSLTAPSCRPILKDKGIPAAVCSPIPMSAQKGYAHYPSAPVPSSQRRSARRSSACRCIPIWMRRRKTASSRRCWRAVRRIMAPNTRRPC